MDKKTGFVKRPTFAELAKLEQKVTYSKPIVRDAVAYWNSFDSAWLKGPLDEVSNRAFLAQQRRAIQQAAINAGRKTGQPPAQIVGSLDRAFNKPHRLDSDEINVQTDGIVSSYYNPAQDHNVLISQEMKRQSELLERLMKEMEERDRTARGAEGFAAGLGSGATREGWFRRAWDTAVPPTSDLGRVVTGAGLAAEAGIGAASISVEGVKFAAETIMRILGTGYWTAASAAEFIDSVMSKYGAADQTAIKAEMERAGFPIPSLRGAPPPAPRPPPPEFSYFRLPPHMRAAGRGYRRVYDLISGARRRDDEL